MQIVLLFLPLVLLAAVAILFFDLLLFLLFSKRRWRLMIGILVPTVSAAWLLVLMASQLGSEEPSSPTLIEIVEFASLPTLGVAILSMLIGLGLERAYTK